MTFPTINQPLNKKRPATAGTGAGQKGICKMTKSQNSTSVQTDKNKPTAITGEILPPEKRASPQQKEQKKGTKSELFKPVEPWHNTVNGTDLLNEIYDTLNCYIACSPETARAATLWICFTWFIDHVNIAPIAIITAPEKRCGKTQLLSFMGHLVKKPLPASNISSAAVYRVIEKHAPTLLIDEADSFLRDNEQLRGVLNSGHTRQTANVIKVTGKEHMVEAYSTWGAKAISGIGKLHGTLMDRGIVLELRRKKRGEQTERLRHADPELFKRLASMLARFSQDAADIIKNAQPELPDALNDRAQDNWEPLLAIADYVGEDWPALARQTALKMSKNEGDALSLSIELLSDIYNVFKEDDIDRIPSEALANALVIDNNRPWSTHDKGKFITVRQIAKLLKGYDIKPKTIRFGAETLKGYYKRDFLDAFERYLPASEEPIVTSSQEEENAETSAHCNVTLNGTDEGHRSPNETPNHMDTKDCYAVTDKQEVTAENKAA